MKKIITLTLFACFTFVFSVQSQENKTVKEESTVKRVIKKEGSKVIVKETEEVKKETGAVIVAGNEEENQTFSEATEKDDMENVLVDEVNVDEKNEALIAAEKKRQEDELKKSIETAKAEAEAQRKMLEEKNAQRLKELEANRKRLERRGKGTGKLKKKKGN